MKLKSTIIDSSMNLIGFMVEGKAPEFGEMGTDTYERAMSMKYLMDIKFNNRQAYFNAGNITEKGAFHINQLDMVRIVNGVPEKVNNTMTLTSRFVRNNENIGFGVLFGSGEEMKHKYDDVMKLSELFHPENFVIKVNDKGRQFIAGKAGTPIGDLPMVEIEDAGKNKKTKSGAKPVSPVTGGQMRNDIDIFDLFDFVDKSKGFILNFPGTKYEATGDTVTPIPSKFKSLNVGEVGNPKIEFSETQFNASCKFKNPGIISMETESDQPVFVGAATAAPVYTFVYRTKNIFYKGENHLSRIGVIIPDGVVHDFYEMFGSSMAITEVTEPNMLAVINRLINWKNSKVFEVDTSKLALIAPSKYDKYIMPLGSIFESTRKLAISKIAMQYIRGELKELGSQGYLPSNVNRKVAAQFAGKTQEELAKLTELGIDVYTGSFKQDGEATRNSSSESTEPKLIPEVSFIIDGLDPKNYNYKKLTTTDKCPAQIASMISDVNRFNDRPEEKRQYLESLATGIESVLYECKRNLWMHKTSSWLKANKLGVQGDDAKSWVLNTGKRTKATCYDCLDSNAPGLQLLVLNTDLAK